MKKYLLLSWLSVFCFLAQAQTTKIDMATFLQNAIYEGLKADAFPKAVVKAMLDNAENLFVPKCQICGNVQKGLRKYMEEKGKRKKNSKLSRKLENGTKREKQEAVQALVADCVKRYRAKHPLTPAEAQELENALEVARKNGMLGMRSDFESYACPSCEGANVK